MQLSLERFQEIIAGLHTAVAGNGDKRRVERASMQFHVKITPCRHASSVVIEEVCVKDFSPRGLGIEHSEEIAAGERFVLHLPSNTRGQGELLCRAVHCRKVQKGQYLIGAEFDCLLSEQGARQAPVSKSELDRIRDSILM